MGLPDQKLLDIITIFRRKEKTPLLNVQLLQQKHIVTDYELVLNPEKGVFCKEFGAELLNSELKAG